VCKERGEGDKNWGEFVISGFVAFLAFVILGHVSL
jgi:hypothetical protein